MSPRSGVGADVYLQLVDALDVEANTVTHAVVRAQVTLAAVVADLRTFLDAPADDKRRWTEIGLRMMRHRSAVVEALDAMLHSDSNRRTEVPTPSRFQPATLPMPPSPRHRRSPVAPLGPPLSPGLAATSAGVRLPEPPRPRRFVLAELSAPNLIPAG
jgi:hypothetical protein